MIICGDTHGLRATGTLIAKKQIEQSTIIHVGDFGLGFQDIGRDVLNLMHFDELLMESNNQLYVIRGNHDNPIFWDKSKGLNLPKFHNLHLVDDYTVLTLEGRNILFVGGATSIDRSERKMDVPYPTWWKDEVFNLDLIKLKMVVDAYDSIDLVITHTAPDFVYPFTDNVGIVNHYHAVEITKGANLKAELKAERKELASLWNRLSFLGKIPTDWFYGHFHSSKETFLGNTRFRLLNVEELYTLY